MLPVDAGVEQCDRDPRPGAPGQGERRGRCPGRGDLCRQPGGIDGAHRVHARDAGCPLERGERPGVDHGREAVQDERVHPVAANRDTLPAERGDQATLQRVRLAGEAALHLRGREPAPVRDPVGERRRSEDDDHPAAGGRTAPAARTPSASSGPRSRLRRAAHGRERQRHCGCEHRGDGHD